VFFFVFEMSIVTSEQTGSAGRRKPGFGSYWKNTSDRLLDTRAAVDAFKRISPQPMAQRHHRYSPGVLDTCLRAALKSSKRPRSPRNRQLTAVAVNFQRRAQLGD
jgi:hypothetical protein